MRKIKVVVLLVQQQHGFTKNAKVSPNLTVAHIHVQYCPETEYTHDIKNGVTTYLLSANQRLANIRQEKPIIHKRPFRIICDTGILLKYCVLSPFANTN